MQFLEFEYLEFEYILKFRQQHFSHILFPKKFRKFNSLQNANPSGIHYRNMYKPKDLRMIRSYEWN